LVLVYWQPLLQHALPQPLPQPLQHFWLPLRLVQMPLLQLQHLLLLFLHLPPPLLLLLALQRQRLIRHQIVGLLLAANSTQQLRLLLNYPQSLQRFPELLPQNLALSIEQQPLQPQLQLQPSPLQLQPVPLVELQTLLQRLWRHFQVSISLAQQQLLRRQVVLFLQQLVQQHLLHPAQSLTLQPQLHQHAPFPHQLHPVALSLLLLQ
jgi:hypothetical protein